MLKAAENGMGLTGSLAMTPAASVSGIYLAHPPATCFNVGRIGDGQVADWARCPGLDKGEVRREASGTTAAAPRAPHALVRPELPHTSASSDPMD